MLIKGKKERKSKFLVLDNNDTLHTEIHWSKYEYNTLLNAENMDISIVGQNKKWYL